MLKFLNETIYLMPPKTGFIFLQLDDIGDVLKPVKASSFVQAEVMHGSNTDCILQTLRHLQC